MQPTQMLALTLESLDQIESMLKKKGFVEAVGVSNPKSLSPGQYIKVPAPEGQSQAGRGGRETPLTVWWLQD